MQLSKKNHDYELDIDNQRLLMPIANLINALLILPLCKKGMFFKIRVDVVLRKMIVLNNVLNINVLSSLHFCAPKVR